MSKSTFSVCNGKGFQSSLFLPLFLKTSILYIDGKEKKKKKKKQEEGLSLKKKN
jgi:hypothetical protein